MVTMGPSKSTEIKQNTDKTNVSTKVQFYILTIHQTNYSTGNYPTFFISNQKPQHNDTPNSTKTIFHSLYIIHKNSLSLPTKKILSEDIGRIKE